MEFRKFRWDWIVPVVVALLCAAGGYWYGKPAPVVETAASEVKQADGSIVVERAPDAKAKPVQMIPKGAKLERIEKIKVQGQGVKMADGTEKACPSVTVDLSLVREDGGAKRVVASSPDGHIVSAIDIPVETAAPPEEPNVWAAGVSMNPTRQTLGVWVERDLSRFRVGAEVLQRDVGPRGGFEARVRVGWKF